MSLPVAVPAAISAIKALVKFTDRLDVIRSLTAATESLPFALPPAPTDDEPHIDEMVAFYREDRGRLILEIRDLKASFEFLMQGDPRRPGVDVFNARGRLLKAYYDATGVRPKTMGPSEERLIAAAPDREMRLAYYVVESHRLSRNPELTRILITAADTILEFGAENAALFTADLRGQKVLATFLEEFAGKSDFDDDSADRILRRLLGSTVAAAIEHYGEYTAKPALGPLFAALADVREDLGDDFVASIISADGFERVLGTYLIHTARDPSFITRDEVLADVLGAVLTKIGTDLDEILRDPRALTGVFETALISAADHVPQILERKLDGRPLLATVLGSVAGAIANARSGDPLFDRIVDGRLLGEVYRSVLEAVAADPSLVGVESDADQLAARLISGLAGALSRQDLRHLSTETLRELGIEGLRILAEHPRLAGSNDFATSVLGAAFAAAARLLEAGARPEDLVEVAEAALAAAAENLALLSMDARLAAVLSEFGRQIAEAGLHATLGTESRKALLLAVLDAVIANPVIWDDFAEADLVRPLAEAVVAGLKNDPTRLVGGPVLVASLHRVLIAAARRGRRIVEQDVDTDQLRSLLAAALERARDEIGRSIDAETLPRFLERVILAFLESPTNINDPQALDDLFTSTLLAA
jgi:hypothetical protein